MKNPTSFQKLSILVFTFFFLSIFKSSAFRAMYVNDFHNIVGNPTAENELLSYAQSRNIETLLLYNLHNVHVNHNLTNTATNHILADFISKAKTNYGITSIGAVAENSYFFTNIVHVYNGSRTAANEKFDIYNLEFEFWVDSATGPSGHYCNDYLIPNGFSCDNAGAFQFYISVLQTMNTLADSSSHPITVESYVGWPTAQQAKTIGENLDLLRLHAYIDSADKTFNYSKSRLIDYANGNPGIDVSIIFSSEPDFMQNWLENNSMTDAENIYTTDWTNQSANWVNNVNLKDFTYFAYTLMKNVPLSSGTNQNNTVVIDPSSGNNSTIVYPTLVTNTITVSSDKEIDEVIVYNVNGQEVKRYSIPSNTKKIDLSMSSISKGIYFVAVHLNSNAVETFKIVKII